MRMADLNCNYINTFTFIFIINNNYCNAKQFSIFHHRYISLRLRCKAEFSPSIVVAVKNFKKTHFISKITTTISTKYKSSFTSSNGSFKLISHVNL